MIRISISLTSLLLLVSQVAFAQEYKSGQMVMVTADAKLQTRKGGVVDEVFPGQVFRLHAVYESFVWVGNGSPGWLDKKHIMPLSEEAVQFLNDLDSTSSQKSKRLVGRSLTYLALKKLDEALADAGEALKLATQDKERAEVFATRAKVWRWKKELDIAIKDIDDALKLDPTDKYYVIRGNIRRDMREYDKAISDYNEAIRINPKNVWAFGYRGRANLSKKDYRKAASDFDKALELDKRCSFVIYDRARAYYSLREFEKSFGDFNAYLKFEPKNRYSLYQATYCLIRLKRGDEALSKSNDYILFFPTDHRGYDLRAESYLQLGELEKARKARAKAQKIKDNNKADK